MLLYTFLAVQSIYELYTSVLGTVIYFAIGLSVLVSLDRLWHVLKCGWVVSKAKLIGREPEDPFKPLPLPDPQFEAHLYPRVAVQLPMFNERAVCQAIIDSACEMHWPHNHFMVQVRCLIPDRTVRPSHQHHRSSDRVDLQHAACIMLSTGWASDVESPDWDSLQGLRPHLQRSSHPMH